MAGRWKVWGCLRPQGRPGTAGDGPPSQQPAVLASPLVERSRPLSVGEAMDKETKREILILTIGTILFEAPFVALAALTVLSH